MKNSSLSTKLIMAAVVLTVLVYFGANLLAYFSDPFTMTVAYRYVSDNSVTISGYVVREEQTLTADGELVYFSRSEGERVSKGGSVAQIYSSEQAFADANRLRAMEEQLEQLLAARTLAGSVQSTGSLDGEVSAAMIAFQTARAGGSISAATDAAQALRAAVLRYNYAYSGTEELERSISALNGEIEVLRDTIRASTTAVRAPNSGLFSSLVDGYETVLTPESLAAMTAEDYRALEPEAAEGIGKMVYGSKWYFVTLLHVSEMGELAQGDRVTLRMQTGLDRDLTLTVERIGEEDGGQRLVVLSSEENLGLTTLLRHQNAQLIFGSYSGIRVPRSAVRIMWESVLDEQGEPVLNADGTEKQRQVYGVYCLWGNTARFKRVNILWQADEYMIVESAQANDPQRCLRPGDQVITAAQELYDGMVIE